MSLKIRALLGTAPHFCSAMVLKLDREGGLGGGVVISLEQVASLHSMILHSVLYNELRYNECFARDAVALPLAAGQVSIS